MELPPPDELPDLPVSVSRGEEPWVVTVSVIAAQNSVVALTWDEVASSAGLRWVLAGIDRMRFEWELVTKVDVRERDGQLEFSVVSRGTDIDAVEFSRRSRLGEVSDTNSRAFAWSSPMIGLHVEWVECYRSRSKVDGAVLELGTALR